MLTAGWTQTLSACQQQSVHLCVSLLWEIPQLDLITYRSYFLHRLWLQRRRRQCEDECLIPVCVCHPQQLINWFYSQLTVTGMHPSVRYNLNDACAHAAIAHAWFILPPTLPELNLAPPSNFLTLIVRFIFGEHLFCVSHAVYDTRWLARLWTG